MEISLLKEIIIEQQINLSKFDVGIKRELLDEIKKFIKLPHILVIAGIRRVGKSTLLFQIMKYFYKNNYYYFNFEDERLLDFQPKDFNNLYETLVELSGEYKTFFFDEIQNVAGWENFVRRMQDKGFKFFITGSNATLLSQELGTKITGRYILFNLYPFSFYEFLCFKKYRLNETSLLETTERAKIKKLFSVYLENGGMPEYLKYKKPEILKNIYEDIMYRDIVSRYEIKGIKALRELSLYYLSNVANLISYNQLKNSLKLGSVNTVKNHTGFFENTFLFFIVNLFSYSLKQQFIAPKKVYCIDTGFINNLAFKFSRNRGKLLENLVFLELKRNGKEIYYYRTSNNLESDFVLREGRNIKFVIQVTQDLGNPKTKNREIKSVLKSLEELDLKEALILTEDNEETINAEGKKLKIQSIYKWLLKKYI